MKKITDRTPSEALNDNLKELYMGINIFENYKKKCKANDLKNLLNEVIDLYSREALNLSSKISSLCALPSSKAGFFERVSEAIYNIKTITADTDSEILGECIALFESKLITLQSLLYDKKDMLDEDSINLIKDMIKENECLNKKLNEYSGPDQADFF